jgi:hypothetical protein
VQKQPAKLGRPRIPEDEKLVSLTIRVTKSQKKRLAKPADAGEIIRKLLSKAGYGKSDSR